MTLAPFSVEPQIAGSLDALFGDFRARAPMKASDLLIEGSTQLLEREDLPLTVRQALHSLKKDTRRVAADRSGFAMLVNAMEYAKHPASALWFPRVLEGQIYGRCRFPTLPRAIAHRSEAESNAGFDVAQHGIHERPNSQSALDELLFTGLVQEVATKAVVASEASEYRVKSVLMRAGF
jgi:hypothetical protein